MRRPPAGRRPRWQLIGRAPRPGRSREFGKALGFADDQLEQGPLAWLTGDALVGDRQECGEQVARRSGAVGDLPLRRLEGGWVQARTVALNSACFDGT